MAGREYGERDRAGVEQGSTPERMRGLGLRDLDSGAILLARLRVADTFWTRFAGLMGVASLGRSEGLLMRHCGSVHTFFMRFPIDVAYLDAEMRVAAVFPAVKPWRVVPGVRGGVHTLEMAAGALMAAGVQAGHTLAAYSTIW